MPATLPIPLLSTVQKAYRDVFGDLGALLRALCVLLFMSVVLVEIPTMMMTDYIYGYVHPVKEKKVEAPASPSTGPEAPVSAETKKANDDAMEAAQRIQPEHMAALMALNLLQMAILVSFLVAWYRQLLLGEKTGGIILFRFGKNELAFAKTLVKASLVLFPVMMVLLSYGLALMPEFSDGKPEDISQVWPVFLICVLLLLYFLASLSMSYPLTIMGETAAPIKDSWRMTKPHLVNIIAGNLMLFIPAIIGSTLIISGVSWLLHLPYQPVPGAVAPEDVHDPFYVTLCLKAFGVLFTFILFALISAYQARVYAFLVRSQQAEPAKD